MKKNKKLLAFALAAMGFMNLSAQTVKLNGVSENRRYDDGGTYKSLYLEFNKELSKALFWVDQGLYTMTWDGATLSTPAQYPFTLEDFYVDRQITDMEKAVMANDFNLMLGNSGAVYVNGYVVTVMSRDEQSTVDDQLFNVRKWNAKTGKLISTKVHPKSECLESAGMAYNPKDNKVYGLFYLTNQKLSETFTNDPDFFEDEDGESSSEDAGYCLCSIDLTTMKITPITPGLYYQNFITFAINSEGRAFALTSGGGSGYEDENGKLRNADNKLVGAQLWEFDLATGLMKTKVVESFDASTGESFTETVNIYDHATGYASQYRRQSACFSKSNPNIMYWNGYYNSGKGYNDWGSWSSLSDKEWRTNGKYDTALYAVDITTGDATRLSKIGNRWTFSCMWVDGDDVSDGADIDLEGTKPDTGAYIALSNAENGAIWQQVEMGKQYTYYLEPAIGWKIHSVSFNNQDITDMVTENNMITTPVVNSEHSSLFVTFEQENVTEAIIAQNMPRSEVKVLGKEGGISVNGANDGDVVQVYTIDGRLVQAQKVNAGQTDIPLASKTLYIIKVGEKTVKVRL